MQIRGGWLVLPSGLPIAFRAARACACMCAKKHTRSIAQYGTTYRLLLRHWGERDTRVPENKAVLRCVTEGTHTGCTTRGKTAVLPMGAAGCETLWVTYRPPPELPEVVVMEEQQEATLPHCFLYQAR